MDTKSVAAMLVDHDDDDVMGMEPEGPMPESAVEDEGQMVAAEEVMHAFKSGDVKALKDALKAFLAVC